MSKQDRLFEIADRQQGYFTIGQARDCGYYDSNVKRYIHSGEWQKIGRGVYRLVRYPMPDRPDLVEWSLWSRNKQGKVQGVWSHETALDLYEVCDIMPSKLHMTVPKNFRKSGPFPSSLKLYFDDLGEKDWIEHQGYRVTTLVRTLIDLASSHEMSDDLLEQAVHEGRRQGMLTKEHINNLPDSDAGKLLRKFYEETKRF
jgi:predicted transcriptional regulator of viral defense system